MNRYLIAFCEGESEHYCLRSGVQTPSGHNFITTTAHHDQASRFDKCEADDISNWMGHAHINPVRIYRVPATEG